MCWNEEAVTEEGRQEARTGYQGSRVRSANKKQAVRGKEIKREKEGQDKVQGVPRSGRKNPRPGKEKK